MPSVSLRVPEDVKAQMEEYDDVNWSAVLRDYIQEELDELESRNIAHAVATSEQLSSAIDPDEVAATNTAETIREFREARYGEERS